MVNEAKNYLDSLFQPTDLICVALIHSESNAIQEVFKTVEKIDKKFLTELEKMNSAGWNVYVCMSPLTKQKRIKANVAAIRASYIEIDQYGNLALQKLAQSTDVPPPHFILESSPNKYQVIWLTLNFTVPEQELLNGALQQAFGGDKACTDVGRLLRIPGFRNQKSQYPSPKPLVTIIDTPADNRHGNPARYVLADFKIERRKPESRDLGLGPSASRDKLKNTRVVVETALRMAGIKYRFYDGACNPNFACRWEISCPNKAEHSHPTDTLGHLADVLIQKDGQLAYHCFHGHCSDKGWKWMRSFLEGKLGRKLTFKNFDLDSLTKREKWILAKAFEDEKFGKIWDGDLCDLPLKEAKKYIYVRLYTCLCSDAELTNIERCSPLIKECAEVF
jgi:hypothetical protein